MHAQLSIELALLGLMTGFLAGLLGIGGGMIMVPFITVMLTNRGVGESLAVKMAIATSMSTIIFTSISSVRAHHKRGNVRWDLVRGLAPGIVLGGALASLGVFASLKGSWLALLFAAFVSFSATQMFLDKKPAPTRQVPGTGGLLGAGGVIGFLSGLVGAGGAFVSVPFMTWCNVASYVISGIGLQNLPPYSFGYLWLPALGVIAFCSVMTAPLGARAAQTLPVKQLKRVFASVLYLLAAYMLYKGLSAAS